MSKYLVLTTVFSIAHHLTEAPTPSLDYWHQAHRPHRPLHSRDAWHCRACRGSQSGWVRQTSQGTVESSLRETQLIFFELKDTECLTCSWGKNELKQLCASLATFCRSQAARALGRRWALWCAAPTSLWLRRQSAPSMMLCVSSAAWSRRGQSVISEE